MDRTDRTILEVRGFDAAIPANNVHQLVGALRLDTLLFAAVDPRSPQRDSALIAQGIDADAWAAWCDHHYRDDALWRKARRVGLAAGDYGPSSPFGSGSAAMATLQASADDSHVWLLAVGRNERPFDAEELALVGLALRLQQIAFDQTPERGMGRLLLTADDRLLHADPRSAYRIQTGQDDLVRVTDQVGAIIEQRWPTGDGGRYHHIILELASGPTWIRFCDQLPHPDLPRWRLLELRSVTADDAPPTGLVEDERIARALAFLTDRFVESPTLNEVAEAVNVSPFHFHRLFTRQVGVSPKHFLLRFQLQMAKWLLRATQMPIGEVAQRSGFSSHGHFTATFHRVVGINPTAYRESHSEG